MLRNSRSVELFDFTRGRIVGQSQAGLSQRQIVENPEVTLSTVNRVLVQFKNEGKENTSPPQVVHSQLRALSVLSRDLWNRILEQLQLMCHMTEYELKIAYEVQFTVFSPLWQNVLHSKQ